MVHPAPFARFSDHLSETLPCLRVLHVGKAGLKILSLKA